MKKRILIVLLILLLTTGCTCEYNLTIDENTYKEEIVLYGENSQEISQFNKEWKIPYNKEEYDLIAGADTEYLVENNIYKYNILSNKIAFSHDFSEIDYNQSTAVSNCYKKLSLTDYNDTLVISTSPDIKCFDKYPTLNNIKVNIKVSEHVINHNADSFSNNIYTWNINRDDINNKSINIIIENKTESDDNITNVPNVNKPTKLEAKYDLYILLAIIAIIIFILYIWFIKFKEKNNDIY